MVRSLAALFCKVDGVGKKCKICEKLAYTRSFFMRVALTIGEFQHAKDIRLAFSML